MSTYLPPDAPALGWVEQEAGGRVVAVRRLRGGITADVDRISVRAAGGAQRYVVLRRWRSRPADGAALVPREVAALTLLADVEVPTPGLIAYDVAGVEVGVPAVLMSALDGEPDLSPIDPGTWMRTMAEAQAAVHAVRSDGLAASPHVPLALENEPSWIVDAGLRRSAVELVSGAVPARAVTTHGDYQPFNVLWHDGRLSGVVDWPAAGTGARGRDVGHMRLNLAVLRGADDAEDYARRYEQASGVPIDVAGDVRALLAWDEDWRSTIPVQLAGRAPVDVVGMPDRVAETIRRTLDRA